MFTAIVPLSGLTDFFRSINAGNPTIWCVKWALFLCLFIALMIVFRKKAKVIGKLGLAISVFIVLAKWMECFVAVVLCDGNIDSYILWMGALHTGAILAVGLTVYIASLVVRLLPEKE